jgi:hypothetical protein
MEQVNNPVKSEKVIAPIEEKRLKTTVNLKQTHVDGLNKIAVAKGMTQTAIIDEALSIALSQFNDTAFIDKMFAETNGFIFNRDLERVTQMLSADVAKKLSPVQIAYLYVGLKDSADRQRVFSVLALNRAVDEIDEVNRCLEIASKFTDGKLTGYNMSTLANQLKAKLSPLQKEYLFKKIGQSAFDELKEKRQDIFAEKTVFCKQQSPASYLEETEETDETVDLFD